MCSHLRKTSVRGKKPYSMIQTAEKFAKDQTTVIQHESEPDAVVGLGRPR